MADSVHVTKILALCSSIKVRSLIKMSVNTTWNDQFIFVELVFMCFRCFHLMVLGLFSRLPTRPLKFSLSHLAKNPAIGALYRIFEVGLRIPICIIYASLAHFSFESRSLDKMMANFITHHCFPSFGSLSKLRLTLPVDISDSRVSNVVHGWYSENLVIYES